MSPTLVPLAVELFTTLLFAGVLYSVRSSLTRRGVAFWVMLWLVRGAASLVTMHYVASTERLVLIFYAPFQIAFSMALIIIAIRLQSQKEQLLSLNEELLRLRNEAMGQQELDQLTGLRSRAALARWLEQEGTFAGLVVVCDVDDFKQINDRYGHLVGDEILHGAGKLISGSIRAADLAFRWGGDEFVIFFQTDDTALVNSRLRHIEDRLQHFQIRQHGTIPVQFSWGLASTARRPLRESLEEADGRMYESKRTRRLSHSSGAN
jgi:diguanylate cyclase (GGDEF)-like protein